MMFQLELYANLKYQTYKKKYIFIYVQAYALRHLHWHTIPWEVIWENAPIK